MQAAKEAVKEFIRHDRHSDTEVREIVKPAITKERIIEENHERIVTAVDKEVHQDHYQTRIQPIIDNQVLAEEHHHRAIPVAVKEHKHGKEREIERALEAERAQFKSTREVLPTQHIKEGAETVVGEHHHHHVYETIQPVIEREIIRPVVTHTTVPIHERIEKEPTFHPKTVQPVMTMEQFLAAGGSVEGRVERRDVFEGEPQVMENGGADVTHPNAHLHRGSHTSGVSTSSAGSGVNAYGQSATTGATTSAVHGTRMSAAERERIMGKNSPMSSPDIGSANRTSAF